MTNLYNNISVLFRISDSLFEGVTLERATHDQTKRILKNTLTTKSLSVTEVHIVCCNRQPLAIFLIHFMPPSTVAFKAWAGEFGS